MIDSAETLVAVPSFVVVVVAAVVVVAVVEAVPLVDPEVAVEDVPVDESLDELEESVVPTEPTAAAVVDCSPPADPPPHAVIAALVKRIAKLVDMRGKELIFNMDFNSGSERRH